MRVEYAPSLPSLAQLLTTAEAHGEPWALFVRHEDGVVELHQTDTFKIFVDGSDVEAAREELDHHLKLTLRAPVPCAEAMAADVELLTTCFACERLYATA